MISSRVRQTCKDALFYVDYFVSPGNLYYEGSRDYRFTSKANAFANLWHRHRHAKHMLEDVERYAIGSDDMRKIAATRKKVDAIFETYVETIRQCKCSRR